MTRTRISKNVIRRRKKELQRNVNTISDRISNPTEHKALLKGLRRLERKFNND